MSFTSKYILVKKIPLNYQEITVESTLRSFLQRRAENVNATMIIKIIRNEDSQTAFIICNNKNLHAENARYLNNLYILGAYIEAKNILFRYKEHVQLHANLNGQLNADLIFDGENAQIQGKRVFSDADGEYYDVLNQLSSRMNNLQLTVNSSVSNLNTNSMPRSLSHQSNLNETNRLMSIPTSSNLTLNNNVADIYANAMRVAGTSRQGENMMHFKCLRCKVDFGKSQTSYEVHVDECKAKEALSLSLKIRQATCLICLNEFLQASSEQMKFLPCGHVLHTECYKALVQSRRRSCPFCRKPIPNEWNGSIYLN